MNSSRQEEWNKGDNEGHGGPVPTIDGRPMKIFREIGKGSFEDPCVSSPTPELKQLQDLWICNNFL